MHKMIACRRRWRSSATAVHSRLLCPTRRLLHTSPPRQSHSSTDPQAVADAFLAKFSRGLTFVRKQYLDPNQLRLFSLTLDRRCLWSGSPDLEEAEPVHGTPLPAGYHLAYFTPAQLPGILGVDGTDASFNPNPPFTRRMWAGGSVCWPSSLSPLQVGDTATEITTVLSCEPKIIKKTGESMLVVGVEKKFLDSRDNLCVLDKRNWVFRTALDPSIPAPIPVKPNLRSESELQALGSGKQVRQFSRDVVLLFRFSALTFNGHRIHYDKPWATEVEGHRNVVVHGPMNLIAMLDMWRDAQLEHAQGGAIYPAQIEYRATSPVYAGEAYRIIMAQEAVSGKSAHVQVVSDDGTLCMTGTITR